MKRIFFLTATLLLLMNTAVFGEPSLNVKIDGVSETTLGNPVLINGRTMLPARAIMERFGFTMSWNPETRTVLGQRDDYTITMEIDSNKGRIQSAEQYLDQPATLVNGSTYVPVRFVSDAIGAVISYDASSKTVNIDTGALKKTFKAEDPVLNAYLIKKAGKETYTVGDFYYMTQLSLVSMGVTHLDGIENLSNLKAVDFSVNEINDLKPLSKLNQLSRLVISDNQIVDLSPIRGMKSLEYLDVRKNRINDFYPLLSMPWIKDLFVTGNATQNYSHLYYTKDKYRTLDVDLSRIERPLYDTPVLNSYRGYEVKVGADMLWLSAMRVGAPSITNEAVEQVLRVEPTSLAFRVNSVYSGLQVMQLMGNVEKSGALETVIPVPEKHFEWRVQPSVSQMAEKKQISSHGAASMVAWMLQSDYSESGVLMAVNKYGDIQTYNYVRIDRRETYEVEQLNGQKTTEVRYIPEYFVFSAEAYLNGGRAVQETGVFADFQGAYGLDAGIIKTGSLEKYALNLKSYLPDVISIISVRQTSGTDPLVPYGVSKSAEKILYLPLEYEAYSEVLLGDSTLLQFHKYK